MMIGLTKKLQTITGVTHLPPCDGALEGRLPTPIVCTHKEQHDHDRVEGRVGAEPADTVEARHGAEGEGDCTGQQGHLHGWVKGGLASKGGGKGTEPPSRPHDPVPSSCSHTWTLSPAVAMSSPKASFKGMPGSRWMMMSKACVQYGQQGGSQVG